MAKTLSQLLTLPKAGLAPAGPPRLRKPAALPKVGKPGAVAGHTHPHANLGKYLHPKGGK